MAAYSYVQFAGDGVTTTFTVPFQYLDKSHVTATVAGLVTPFSWLTDSTISITPAPTGLVEIRRRTPKDTPAVDFSDGSVLKEKDLDLLATFGLYCAQEAQDVSEEAVASSSLGTALSKVYQGVRTDPPTQRNDGTALKIGDMYFDSDESTMKVFTGVIWQVLGPTVPGILKKPSTPVIANPGDTTIPIPEGYDPAGIIVFVNGSIISPPEIDTSSGTDVIFTTPLDGGEEITWLAFGVFAVVNVYSKTELAQAGGSTYIGFKHPAPGSVLRKLSDALNDIPISVLHMGAKGDGVTDDTAKIQAALDTGRPVYLPTPSVGYYCTSDLIVKQKQLIFGDGESSRLILKDGTVNGFVGTGLTGVTIRGLSISVASATNATAYKAAVNLVSCSYCTVQNVQVSGMGYHGVRLYDSSYCRIVENRFSGFFGTIQDQSDIAVMNNSSYNRIEGNFCYGGGDHGILVQDPYTGSTPTGNVINRNIVGTHKANGIIVYVTTAFDTQTIISNNRVAGITGTALSGKSGAGIYIQSAGGSIVTGNHISDCCQQTVEFSTQGVGHIAVAIGQYSTGQLTEVIVENNHINAPRGPGIYCASSNVPILVANNTVMTTGVWTSVTSTSIYAVNCEGVRILNNTVRQSNPNYNAIQVAASNQNVSGLSISGNWVKTAAYGISANAIGTGTFSDASVNNNRVFNGNSTALNLEKITYLTASGNDLDSTGVVFVLNSCSGSRFSNNRIFSSAGSYGVIFTGSGSDNIVNESNLLGSLVENDATSGTLISQYSNNAPPISGLWATGDRVIAKTPNIGTPKGWRCTANGNPGTWVSEGNL